MLVKTILLKGQLLAEHILALDQNRALLAKRRFNAPLRDNYHYGSGSTA